MEGNSINLTDPFGLSPSCGKSDFGHGMLNLLGMIPGIGEGFDMANAIWYFKEGNLMEGVLSLLSGLPIVGSIAVGGVKLFKGGKKAFETAEKFHKACRLISNGATFARAGTGFINSGKKIYKEYVKNGKPLDGNFALQAGSMALNGVTMLFSGKAFIKDFKSMKLVDKIKNAAKKAVGSVKTDFKSFMKDNRGGVDLSFGNGGTKDIYRAVGPEEFEDIMNTSSFRGRPDGRSYEAKQFGNNFDEVLDLANQPIMRDTAAIVKVTIPQNVYDQLNHMPLDVGILKSGSITVEPEMLNIFNNSIINIEHAY